MLLLTDKMWDEIMGVSWFEYRLYNDFDVDLGKNGNPSTFGLDYLYYFESFEKIGEPRLSYVYLKF